MTLKIQSGELWRAAGALKRFSSSASAWSTPATLPRIDGYREYDSTNNKWLSRPHGKGDVGSDFTLYKSSVISAGPKITVGTYRFGVYTGYDGHIFVGASPILSSAEMQSMVTGRASEPELMAHGTTAIAECIPTNPVSDLPLALAEIYNDGLPGIPGFSFLRNRRMDHQVLSGQYLNYQFAVKPLLADMRKFNEAVKKAERLIDDYARNAGKVIRRRYEFSPQISSFSTVVPNPPSQGKTHLMGVGTEVGIQDRLLSNNGGNGGVRTDFGTNTIKRWFSGAFVYHLPNAGRDFSSRLAREEREMRYLYGGISASTAWNLIPFSWAADWITNAGDVIHNISAFSQDGLVMPWGYIMEQCDHYVTRQVVGARIGNGLLLGLESGKYFSQLPQVVSTTLSASSKRRRKATPYGFGLITSDLTERQWAILAALGLSWG